MNRRQKEVLAQQARDEQRTLDELKKIYKEALDEIDLQIAAMLGRKDVENLQSIIYQVQYQKALRAQIDSILTELNARQFKTVSDYLIECYEKGFLGAMYDLHGQGIPIIVPVAQNQVVAALTKESKLSKTLYDSLGENVAALKKKVSQTVSRGIASGLGYGDIARGIAAKMVGDYRKFSGGALYCAERITRTEGHTIQNRAALDAQVKAKEKGADIVKQWDATLDGRTRPDHRAADGQLREVDDDFDVGGEKMPAPGIGGSAKNVVHCRCALLQRARWALDEDELETLKERAEYFGLDKTKDFDEFREKYMSAVEKAPETGAKYEPVKSVGKKDLPNGGDGGTLLSDIVAKNYEVTESSLGRLPQKEAFQDVEVDGEKYQAVIKRFLRAVKRTQAEPGIEFSVVYSGDMRKIGKLKMGKMGSVKFDTPGEIFHAFHNHGSDKTLSYTDVCHMLDRDNQLSVAAVGNRGSFYGLFSTAVCDRDGYDAYISMVEDNVIYAISGQTFSLKSVAQIAEGKAAMPPLSEDQASELAEAIVKATTDMLRKSESYGFKYIEVPAVVVK